MSENDIALVGLQLIPGIGGGTIRQLISHAGSASKIFRMSTGKLDAMPGIGRKKAQLINENNIRNRAIELFERAGKQGTKIITIQNPEFPKLLKEAYDAPLVLYKKGNSSLNSTKCISIVGTRNATHYGIDFTRELIEGLKPHNPLVISGLAYGIDHEAHFQALKSGLKTVAVMASGINYIYPARHKSIAQDIIGQGALITEYPFDELPEPGKFPARNRIIAGMSHAVVVVEAANKGGALITADIANSYDREVFALPGKINNKFSEGCNQLIKRHEAHILTKPEDIEYLLDWGKTTSKPTEIIQDLTSEEAAIFKLLTDESDQLIDDISWKTGIALNRLASVLLNLEFKGFVRQLPGKKFGLTAR